MKILHINKTKIVYDFKRLSNIWNTSNNITLRLNIRQQDFDFVVRSLIKYLPNDLAYTIMSEIAECENLNEELMQLIYDKGDKGCKVAICLNKNLSQELQKCCKQSNDIDIKEHYQQRECQMKIKGTNN
ncbi:hypothetical protein [Prevotella intermedia]|uniref:hypothetical protein n=1 Tax=Prevotella intermedia TaxID=28131 RepID=UPI00397C1CBA